MMSFTKEELMENSAMMADLHDYFDNLHNLVTSYQADIRLSDDYLIPHQELRLSELFTAYNSAKIALSIHPDLAHYEFTSYISFFERYYSAAKELFTYQSNPDQLESEFENMSDQYLENIDPMIRSRYEENKKLITEL